MKRIFKLLMVMAIALVLVAPAQAEWRDMWAAVYKLDNTGGDDRLTQITSGITFKVLQADSDSAETLYVMQDKSAFTSLTNPVTTTNFNSATVCDDLVSFRVDPGHAGDEYVDLIVVDTNGGFTAFVENFDRYTHQIVIDQRPNVQHHGSIWYSDTTTSEVDTGIDFLYDTDVVTVFAEVVTAQSGGTLSVGTLSSGTNGDADGFLATEDISSAGFPALSLADSGALMDDATNYYPNGYMVRSANEQSLTYTCGTTTGTAAGYIHYLFVRTR